MPEETSANDSSNIDGMLGAFFGSVGNRAFGKLGGNIDGIDSKFKRLENVAQSSFASMRTGANRASDAVDALTRKLKEQTDKIRKMPKIPNPLQQPRGGQPRDPETGRWLPGRGRGAGGGGGGPRFGSRFSPGGGLGGISAFGGLGSVGALFAGASVARGFSSFDANLATIQAEAGLDAQQRKDVTGQILDISGSTAFNTSDVSGALIQMIRDGVKLGDALATVPNVLKLAVAESKDLQTAWNATNTIISGLNLPLSESTRLMDMMSNSTSLSKLQLEQIQYIAGQSLSLYSQIGGFSEEGFFGISGILGPLFRPERIGTGLKQLSLLLPQAASGQLAGGKNDIFESWGVNITDPAGNLKDEVSVLKEFEKAFAGMSGEMRNVELAKVFGTEAAPVFSALIGKSAQLATNMEAIRKKGTLDEKYAVHAESLKVKWDLLTSAGDSLIKKFVMILNESGAFGGGIEWLTEKITQFTVFMESNKEGIQSWWGNFQEILGGLFNLVGTGIEKFNAFWSGLSEGEKTLALIGGIILTFLANPVAGVIAAGALIVAKWQPIKAFFIQLFNDITWSTFEAGESIKETWEGITGFFSGIWGSITGTAKSAWNDITAFFSEVWDVITSPARKAVSFFQDVWGGLPDKLKEPLQSAFGAISEKFGDFTEKLKAPMEKFFNWIGGGFDWLKARVIETLNVLPGVQIGGGALVGEGGVLPNLKRVEGETDQMYKFRQMQARDRLRGLKDSDFNRFNTLDAETEKKNKAREQAIKRQRRLSAGTTALGGFENYDFFKNYEPPKVPKVLEALKELEKSKPEGASKKPEFYESRAVSAQSVPSVKKPEAGLTDFFDEQDEILAERSKNLSSMKRLFDIKHASRGLVGARNIEDIYKIDDSAMSNVREHFEDTAEKEFFSGLQTYAEQSFSHIESTLTEATRSMREKMWKTQKFIKEDKEKWQKIMESGAFDKLSTSMTAAGARAGNKEVYELLMGALSSGGAAGLGIEMQTEDRIPAVLQSLEGRIPTEKFDAVVDLFKTLSKNAEFAPGIQRALNIDTLSKANTGAIERAGLKRGHELLVEVMRTSDTVTQAEKRLSETDAGLLQSAFEQLKPFADQLPQMRSLLARESMLTGTPKGTKMNVFEFPTLTKEQHVELVSVFRSHFLTLTDINSAQLAVLKYIAGVLGGGDFSKSLGTLGTGPVIKQQYGTLDDEYLKDRDFQVQSEVQRNLDALASELRPAEPQTPQSQTETARNEQVVKSRNVDRVVINIPIHNYGNAQIDQELIERLKAEVRAEIEATLREANF